MNPAHTLQKGNRYRCEFFHGGSDGKASDCNMGDLGLIPGLGRFPGEGNGNPLQYSCLENSLDGGRLIDYSPWGLKESDETATSLSLSLTGVTTKR